MDGANIIRRRGLDAVPLWIDGHLQSARLSASLDRAIATQPRERSLWLARCESGVRREAFDAVKEVVARADAASVAGAELDFYRAVAAGELGDPGADHSLSNDAVAANPGLALWRIRHLLRHGRVAECRWPIV